MPVIPPQPPIPPARPAGRPRQQEPLGHFSIVGVDQMTNRMVTTVIEARSEDDAQRIAQAKGIIVHEFKPMHPLAGAAALKMARADPNDRFNEFPSYVETVESFGGQDASEHHYNPGPGVPGAVREPAPTSRGGVLAVLTIIAVACGLMYVTVFQQGGTQVLADLINPAPEPTQASITLSESSYHLLDTGETPSAAKPQVQRENGQVLKLEATVPPRDGRRGSAVISGQILKPGDRVGGYRLVQVHDGWVLLQRNGKLVALKMPKDKPTT